MTEELKAIQLSVQQKLGWNMLLFQHLEKQLKLITPFMDVQGVELTMDSIQKVHDAKSNRSILGSLFGKFRDSLKINTEEEAMRENAAAVEVQEEWITKLQVLADSRNEIVHHFFDNYKLDSIEDLTKAEKFLDEQQKDIIAWLKTFSDITKAFAETSYKSVELMDSISVVKRFVDVSGMRFEYTIPDEN